jgi:hypothetical protein
LKKCCFFIRIVVFPNISLFKNSCNPDSPIFIQKMFFIFTEKGT